MDAPEKTPPISSTRRPSLSSSKASTKISAGSHDGGHAPTTDLEKSASGVTVNPTSASGDNSPSEPLDPYIVTWESPSDPTNPRNWSPIRKWTTVAMVSLFAFISPVTSSMIAPGAANAARDLGIKTEFGQAMVVSIFVLAFALGPMVFGPLSELYGRVRVIQGSNLFYLLFNLGCGFAKTGPQMLAFRFLAGFGGSALIALGGGTMADMFVPEERGRALALYSIGLLVGPAVGPVAGGFINERTSWRWVFWSLTIVCAAAQMVGVVMLRETYPPTLLHRKAAALRKQTGNQAYHTAYDAQDQSPWKLFATAFERPVRLLLTQPIVIMISLYQLYVYGLIYTLLTTFPRLWSERYGQTGALGSLNCISLGLGSLIGAQINGWATDRMYARLTRKYGGVSRPEYRIPLIFVGALLASAGLFIYGWSAQYRVHWFVPNLGVFIFSAGGVVVHQCSQTYLIDVYTLYAASALAAMVFLRSLAGFGLPLAAPYMYQKLDYGWGNTVLALIALVIGVPAPFLSWLYGPKLRAKSKYASG